MEVCILGPVQVRDGERVIDVSGTRVRRLLVRLAVDAPQPVSAGQLVEAVWYDDDAPAQVANALQSLVSRLRRGLGRPDAVRQTPAGYRLDGTEVDVTSFGRLAAEGRRRLASGDVEGAGFAFRRALGMWAGPPLVDAGEAPYAMGVRARLSEARLEALADRLDADLAAGLSAELVAELEDLTLDHPLRERFVALQMTALARSGRAAEALATFASLRERLAEELGTDPSPSLQDLHLRILRGEVGDAPEPAGRRKGLSAALTTFVGREDELKRVHELLATARLTTIVGPGGAGKTRLAIEAARSWDPPRRWDGEWLVELASVTDEENVVHAFLASLGVREGRLADKPTDRPVSRDPLTRLMQSLDALQCLLVVDNCEHVVDAVAQLLGRVLASSPGVRVLATSREPVGIDGESLCVVPPLALPPVGAGPAEALATPAVELFASRAAAVSADFEVRDDNVAAVVEIVRRLDGLPLALELAAARMRVLPVGEIAARLGDRFRLLTGGSRAAMPRHRTLRAVVEWSWDLLSPPERLLAERLAVFPAGATPNAAEKVCAADGLEPAVVPPLLDSLVDKSLITVGEGEQLRYRMLETIREFGIERLAERGEIEAARRAHARYFAELVAWAGPQLRAPEQVEAFATVEREHDNIAAAMRFLADSGDGAQALPMAVDLSWYWMLRNEHSDAHEWLALACSIPGAETLDLFPLAEAGMIINQLAALESHEAWSSPEAHRRFKALAGRLETVRVDERFEPHRVIVHIAAAMLSQDEEIVARTVREHSSSADPWTRAVVRSFRAALAENQGDVGQMRADVLEVIEEFRRLGDRWGLAMALSSSAYVHTLDGELDAAVAAYEEAACLMEELGAGPDSGFMRVRLAGVRVRQQEYDAARRDICAVLDSSANRSEEVAAFATAMLAHIAWAEGDLSAARRLREEVESRLGAAPRMTGPPHGHLQALSLAVLALLYADDGDAQVARRFVGPAYPAAIDTQDQPVMANVGVSVAWVAARLGQFDRAAEMLGAAAALRGGDDVTDPAVHRLWALLEAELDDDFAPAYQRGRVMARDDARSAIDPTRLDAS